MRAPNAIDFWRGFALVDIFLSHMPGNPFERFSHRHYSLSDAELFVFLAGWSMRLATKSNTTSVELARHALARVTRLYKVHIATVVSALVILTVASHLVGDHAIARWGNAGAIADDPWRAWLGSAMLTHQLQYFDIMPLYITLGLFAPLVILLDRRSSWLLMMCSTVLWALVGVTRLDLPTWPVAGGWFFDPLAWQLPLALGFVLAGDGGPARLARAAVPLLFRPALAIAIAGGVAVACHRAPDATIVDFGVTSLLFSKTFIGPARLLHFVAMLIVCVHIFPLVLRHAAPVAGMLSMLGRQSIPVFTAASLLSLIGRVARQAAGTGVLPALIMVAFGVTSLFVTARLCERRHHHRRRADAPRSLRRQARTVPRGLTIAPTRGVPLQVHREDPG